MTPHDRYHISDPICGLFCTRTSLKKALESARNHQDGADGQCQYVTVFDSMARYDCVQLWDAKGKILEFRKRETAVAS